MVIETVIIGGGQAGLAVGYHLAKRDRPFVILEANQRVGESWRNRWDSLVLFTAAKLSGLPGWPFPAPAWSFPTKDEVAEYVEAYAARFELPVRTGVRVDRLARMGPRLVVASGDQTFEADHVVVATGGFQAPRIPEFASELDPSIMQLHSSQYRNPSQLCDGDVLVVGAGNSGADIALELSRSHRTWLSGRHPGSEPTRPGSAVDRAVTPAFWYVISNVLSVNNRLGRKLRPRFINNADALVRVKPKDLATAGVVRVARTVRSRDGRPVLEDGAICADVTNVIWCTGFRTDFGWIDLPIFDGDGQPEHERGIVAAEAGLYFVGLFFLTSLSSSLIGGVGRDAEHIADHIAANGMLSRTETPG